MAPASVAERRQLAAVRRAEDAVRRLAPRTASTPEIARRTGIDEHVVNALRRAGGVMAALEAPLGEDRTVLGDVVADENAVDPLLMAIARDDRRAVWRMLRQLEHEAIHRMREAARRAPASAA